MPEWVGRINQIDPEEEGAGYFSVHATFFDMADVGFTTPLAETMFNVESGTTNADLLVLLEAQGVELRDGMAADTVEQADVGATVDIP